MAIIIKEGKNFNNIDDIMQRHFSEEKTCAACLTTFIPELEDINTRWWESGRSITVPCPRCNGYSNFYYYNVRDDEVQTIRHMQIEAEPMPPKPWWRFW